MTLSDPPAGRENGVTAQTSVVVEVEDKVTVGLVGRDGCSYESPPLPRAGALALVRVLTGRSVLEADDRRWTCPIAGGQRTVTLRPAAGTRGRAGSTVVGSGLPHPGR